MLFTIIYDDKYRKSSLSKYNGTITYEDSQKIIKSHKYWFRIDDKELQETKNIIKNIFKLDEQTKLLGATYKDALVLHIDYEKHKNIYYCIKIIDNKVEAYLLKGRIEMFIDDDENFFEFIEMVMFDGENTQNIYEDL